jgi:predicted Zn-dependent peptidase
MNALPVHRLPNGVRLVALPAPALSTAAVAVFVRTGSAHEHKLDNGISHLVEHMLFKGTATRDARRINLDAEVLGADVLLPAWAARACGRVRAHAGRPGDRAELSGR